MLRGLISNFSPLAAIKRIRSIFSERRCAVCRTPHTYKNLLCSECLSKIRGKPDNLCHTCGKILTVCSKIGTPCLSCIENSPAHKRLYYYGPYDGLLRDLILDWKFNNNFGYGSVLSQLAISTAETIPENSHPDVVIPVPLHPSRLRERGFNQSRIIGSSVAKSLKAELSDCALIRKRKTTPQTQLSKSKRTENIKGAFIADSSVVAGKNILLIDDVYTTGSTAGECCHTLYEAGALCVEVLVLAKPLI